MIGHQRRGRHHLKAMARALSYVMGVTTTIDPDDLGAEPSVADAPRSGRGPRPRADRSVSRRSTPLTPPACRRLSLAVDLDPRLTRTDRSTCHRFGGRSRSVKAAPASNRPFQSCRRSRGLSPGRSSRNAARDAAWSLGRGRVPGHRSNILGTTSRTTARATGDGWRQDLSGAGGPRPTGQVSPEWPPRADASPRPSGGSHAPALSSDARLRASVR